MEPPAALIVVRDSNPPYLLQYRRTYLQSRTSFFSRFAPRAASFHYFTEPISTLHAKCNNRIGCSTENPLGSIGHNCCFHWSHYHGSVQCGVVGPMTAQEKFANRSPTCNERLMFLSRMVQVACSLVCKGWLVVRMPQYVLRDASIRSKK